MLLSCPVVTETTDMGLFLPVTADSISKDGEGQGSSDVQTLANQQTAAQQSHLQPITVSISMSCNVIVPQTDKQ